MSNKRTDVEYVFDGGNLFSEENLAEVFKKENMFKLLRKEPFQEQRKDKFAQLNVLYDGAGTKVDIRIVLTTDLEYCFEDVIKDTKMPKTLFSHLVAAVSAVFPDIFSSSKVSEGFMYSRSIRYAMGEESPYVIEMASFSAPVYYAAKDFIEAVEAAYEKAGDFHQTFTKNMEKAFLFTLKSASEINKKEKGE